MIKMGSHLIVHLFYKNKVMISDLLGWHLNNTVWVLFPTHELSRETYSFECMMGFLFIFNFFLIFKAQVSLGCYHDEMTYAKAYLPPIMNIPAENVGHNDMGPRPGVDPHSSSARRSHCQVKLSGKGREMQVRLQGFYPWAFLLTVLQNFSASLV